VRQCGSARPTSGGRGAPARTQILGALPHWPRVLLCLAAARYRKKHQRKEATQVDAPLAAGPEDRGGAPRQREAELCLLEQWLHQVHVQARPEISQGRQESGEKEER